MQKNTQKDTMKKSHFATYKGIKVYQCNLMFDNDGEGFIGFNELKPESKPEYKYGFISHYNLIPGFYFYETKFEPNHNYYFMIEEQPYQLEGRRLGLRKVTPNKMLDIFKHIKPVQEMESCIDAYDHIKQIKVKVEIIATTVNEILDYLKALVQTLDQKESQ
ncbi:MAG: hypothetical protein P1Q69_07335 [Candidatus Thorarchaeota archaeon]|nr:hypothetical protein [Candidatus Thorarchaeota archaeon]